MLRDAYRHAGAAVACFGATFSLFITSCAGTGGFRVIPEPLRPELGEYLTRTIIRGRCYLTDGRNCIPCNGGPPMECAQLLLLNLDDPTPIVTPMDASVGPPPPPQQDDAPPRAPAMFAGLTGGLDGLEWAKLAGFTEWVPGEAIEVPFHATLSADADMLDVSFLWWSAWDRPTTGELPAGVQVHEYASGDFTDLEPDLMLIRVFGPTRDVQKAMSVFGDPEVAWFEPEDGP